MLYVETESLDAAYNFSTEQFFAENLTDEPVFMIWQAERCVMLGSNQIAGAEIDMGEAENAGVRIVRRASGGGAIFCDMGTLLCSVISPYNPQTDDAKQAANKVLATPLVDALSQMGVPAVIEGRNDLLADGKKFCGMAQYIQRGALCSHCSLLFDTDIAMLARVLRPDNEKIRSKALRSIQSRVTNIAGYMRAPCSAAEFWRQLKDRLFRAYDMREYRLTESDRDRISRIRDEKFNNPVWIHEKTPRFSYRNSRRFAGGRIEAFLEIDKGVVQNCTIRGDFLALIPIRSLEERIEGRPYLFADISEVLEAAELTPYIGSVSKQELLSCLF